MARLGLLTLHGMGNTKRDYAEELFDHILDSLGPQHEDRIRMVPVYYQDILQENQTRYFKKVKRRLRWDDLREFMLYGFSDAASLESQKEGTSSPYFQAQAKILEAFRALHADLDGPGRRVIVVAQSLGGQVISNYLWDALKQGPARDGVWSVPQQFSGVGQEEFCRGKGVVRLLTTGCNIPLFVSGMDPEDIEPIPKPNHVFEWYNFFDRDDVLGWPLRNLNDKYAERVARDIAINAGLITGFTPLSHQNYWRDRDFLRPLTRLIKGSL